MEDAKKVKSSNMNKDLENPKNSTESNVNKSNDINENENVEKKKDNGEEIVNCDNNIDNDMNSHEFIISIKPPKNIHKNNKENDENFDDINEVENAIISKNFGKKTKMIMRKIMMIIV